MLVLLGPSASGKTESAKIMINRYPISRVVTCTTRKKRVNEIDGFDYHFLTEEEFKNKKEKGYFVETAFYNNHHYGTPYEELSDDKLIILEPNGLESFLRIPGLLVVAIYLQTSEEVRIQRMQDRNDPEALIRRRIECDREEFDPDKIEGLDLVIDTTNINLSDLADKIYKDYYAILKEKKHFPGQLSLFGKHGDIDG